MSIRKRKSEPAPEREPELNRLLASLPNVDTLRPLLERATYATEETLCALGADLEHYVFPRSGITSTVYKSPSGGTVEVGTAGAEGMLGTYALVGIRRHYFHTFAQSPIIADRIAVDTLDRFLVDAPRSRDVLLRYGAAVHHEASQYIACSRLHSLEARLARWLLLSHDRHGTEAMPLTQKFLSFMLGVHRPAVSVAAENMKQAGLIRYSRGHIIVEDRAGLERASCECYDKVRAFYRDAELPWGIRSGG
jgi:CRP-like cAMP-binding protein